MRRHLIPHATWSGWQGDGLTIDPNGGVELPPGMTRSLLIAMKKPTTTRRYDEVVGGTICIQWFGLIAEFAIGKVR